ncbi:putative pollen allergen Ole e 1 family [Helianthus annuus]|nr:putative pollen allergen Ole e 1 family [Helianthus annuus]KAJ0692092.1 putative pollen allergen Ole e 1 family [Helianthus annuus]
MVKLLVIFALCLLPALSIAATLTDSPFRLKGRVYCDTCRAGFETSVTKYLAGLYLHLCNRISLTLFPCL